MKTFDNCLSACVHKRFYKLWKISYLTEFTTEKELLKTKIVTSTQANQHTFIFPI